MVRLTFATPDPSRRWIRVRRPSIAGLGRYGTVLGLIVMIAVFSFLKPETFPTWSNFLTIFDDTSLLAIVAGGLTVCLILNEFDLSIGFTVTLGGIIATQWLDSGLGVPESVLIGLAAGLLVGLVNGLVVTQFGVSAFIATLATGAVINGIIIFITGGQPNTVLPPGFSAIGQSTLVTISSPVLIAVGVLILLWTFLNRTEGGRRIDATGGNTKAARFAGIRVNRYRMLGFVISALCAALAGVVLAARLGAGYTDAGNAYLLDAFTACFLGAVTFHDGRFNILGTLVGVLILAVTFNGLNQLGVPSYWQDIVKGLILIFAVAGSGVARGFSTR